MKFSIFIVSTIFYFFTGSSFAASFDCDKATQTQEKIVCSDPELSSLDDELAKFYKEAKSTAENPEIVKSAQILWIKSVRECSDAKCIKDLYLSRISQLVAKKVTTEKNLDSQKENIAENSPAPKDPEIAKPSDTSKEKIEVAPQIAVNTDVVEKSPEDSGTAGAALTAFVISILAQLVSAIINQSSSRRKIGTPATIRSVRDIGAGMGPLLLGLVLCLFPSFVLVGSLRASTINLGVAFYCISIIFLVSYFFGRVFSVREGGIVYDILNEIVEVPGGGSSIDSILSYLNPVRWFEFLRRVSIPCSSITGITGETLSKTTTSYNKMLNVVQSNTTETHILTLITTDGEWNIKCSSRSKKSAMKTLICEAADLN